MILVDACVFMYAVGAPHPLKERSLGWLDRAAAGEIEAAVDAEVLQEILHRYRALHRWKEGRVAYDLARRAVPLVVPLTARILDEARALLDRHPKIMARDALHAAACRIHRAEGIASFDTDLDGIEGVLRIEP
ncbi:MAG: type II toxin-antitoxin system VapC family toxin [Planctomycetes bacterium]|nr:type II toxin-antitoxin system VapC family toxin [Planctomycetota bacterium]